MADLSQHKSYDGAYSGLLDNFYVTLAIAGVCLLGHEIGVHISRRRGRDGPFKRIPVGLVIAAKRTLDSWRYGENESSQKEGRVSNADRAIDLSGEEGKAAAARKRLGSREAWEFG